MNSRTVHLSGREVILQSLIWQSLWLWLVWSAGRESTALPLIATGLVLGLAMWRAGSAKGAMLKLIAVAIGWGVIGDGLLAASGLVTYSSLNDQFAWCPPWWILALWAQFAAALVLPLRRILTSPLIAAVMGVISGPLAYLGGQKLGALQFPADPWASYAAVAVVFGLGTPLLVMLANHWLTERRIPSSSLQPTAVGA